MDIEHQDVGDDALPIERVATNSWLTIALSVLGLTTLGIAQPVLDLVGSNPSFFVAHRSGGWAITSFALVVYLLPPIVIIAVVSLFRLLPGRAFDLAGAFAVGLLAAYTLVSIFRRPVGWSTIVFLLTILVVGGALSVAFVRQEAVASLTRILGYISPLIVLWFLFASAAADLIGASEVEAVGSGATTDLSVVLLVLDELPAASLLRLDGTIDEVKVPNFARLAETSTWYSETATVASRTNWAVPAITTGQMPTGKNIPPDAGGYPQNLFTLVAPSHRLEVDEVLTRLCPENLCPQATDVDTSLLYEDGLIAAGHIVLPHALANRWFPPISDRWTNFADTAADAQTTNRTPSQRVAADLDENQTERFASFVNDIDSGTDPTLWYHHSGLPHVPWTYLPDGRVYNGAGLRGLTDGDWTDDERLVDNDAFRHTLQVELVDNLIGDLLDRLEEQGRLDDTLLIVTSDHGAAFVPGTGRRKPDDTNIGGIAHVPLFVKYPGQTSGAIDDRRSQTIDILPTISEVIGLELPKASLVDGISLLEDVPDDRSLQVVSVDAFVDVIGAVSANSEVAVAAIVDVVPENTKASNSYVRSDLIDDIPRDLAELETRGLIKIKDIDGLTGYDPGSSVVPALMSGQTEGISPTGQLVVLIDGLPAGNAPVADDGRVVVMLDPMKLRGGAVTIEVIHRDSTSGDWVAVEVENGRPTQVIFDSGTGELASVAVGDKSWDQLRPGAGGSIDSVPGAGSGGGRDNVVGWSADVSTAELPVDVLLISNEKVIGRPLARIARPDVVEIAGSSAVELAGWTFLVDNADLSPGLVVVSLYDDGTFHTLKP